MLVLLAGDGQGFEGWEGPVWVLLPPGPLLGEKGARACLLMTPVGLGSELTGTEKASKGERDAKVSTRSRRQSGGARRCGGVASIPDCQ